MSSYSSIILPLLVLIIIIYGFTKKVNLYDSFVSGAKEGLSMSVNIFPFLLAMTFSISIFLKSNFIIFALSGLKDFFLLLRIPFEVLPMTLIRPISGSASLVFLNDLFTNYGPDSYIGRLGSTIQGCTDTTLYVLTLYFGSVKISKIRYSLKVGLFADLVGIIVSILIVNLIF